MSLSYCIDKMICNKRKSIGIIMIYIVLFTSKDKKRKYSIQRRRERKKETYFLTRPV